MHNSKNHPVSLESGWFFRLQQSSAVCIIILPEMDFSISGTVSYRHIRIAGREVP